MFSLAAEGRGNIVHKEYPALVLIKCPVYSRYKVKDTEPDTSATDHSEVLYHPKTPQNSKEKDSEQTVNNRN